jgi:hypothetical protein
LSGFIIHGNKTPLYAGFYNVYDSSNEDYNRSAYMIVRKILKILSLTSVLILFLTMTDPKNISLLFVLVPYILAGLVMYLAVSLILEVLLNGLIAVPKLKLYALIITVLTINFALIKSIGQLTFQDGAISVAIMVVSVIYISKFSLAE